MHPDLVPVLVVAHLPGGVVRDGDPFGQRHGLAEVDQPDPNLVVVVDEQQGTADELLRGIRTCFLGLVVGWEIAIYLVSFEEIRVVQGVPDLLQSLQILFL